MVNEPKILKPLTLLNPPANIRLLNYLPEESSIPFPGNHTTNLRGRCFTKWHSFLTSLSFFFKETVYFLSACFHFKSLWGLPQWLNSKESTCPTQETRVPSLVWEYPTCCGATKPMSHNYWACALEPWNHNSWSPNALEPVFHKWSHYNEKPKHCN